MFHEHDQSETIEGYHYRRRRDSGMAMDEGRHLRGWVKGGKATAQVRSDTKVVRNVSTIQLARMLLVELTHSDRDAQAR